MASSHYSRVLGEYPSFRCFEGGRRLFTYAHPTVPELVRLREMYSLDEVAGEGDDWSQATGLMNWTFQQLFCVGERQSLEPRNALHILAHRQQGQLLCIHQAIVLNEALLAMGIPSRLLWCYPYQFDGDCHVVVTAFTSRFAKWVVLDPTFNTYFHDQEGVPLSIPEVRASYAAGHWPSFRHISIDKSWVLVMNGVECETYDQFYRLYMAKNCFRFSSPAHSGFGCAYDEAIARVFLHPTGFSARNQYDASSQHPEANVYTDNACAFFAVPAL